MIYLDDLSLHDICVDNLYVDGLSVDDISVDDLFVDDLSVNDISVPQPATLLGPRFNEQGNDNLRCCHPSTSPALGPKLCGYIHAEDHGSCFGSCRSSSLLHGISGTPVLVYHPPKSHPWPFVAACSRHL